MTVAKSERHDRRKLTQTHLRRCISGHLRWVELDEHTGEGSRGLVCTWAVERTLEETHLNELITGTVDERVGLVALV
jgi:hypothetical protein